ncbi:MAG: lipoyl synthase [Bacteroidales bacterium]|nr:lipoyl synthase [Bacteroidales bacterium]
MDNKRTGKPDWLKSKLPAGKQYIRVRDIVASNKMHTICTSGHCPNLGECWGRGTATLMILGDICTRSCKFCNVKTGKPLPPDPDEPARVAKTVRKMGVKHCVITSVDRDDLPDGGASVWAKTLSEIRLKSPTTTLETLIPDFDGTYNLLDIIIQSSPEVISHNLETVERLTPLIRSKAKYRLSLDVLKYISEAGIRSKSGIMAGIGETEKEVYQTMDDLLSVGCQVFTIGQYLQPTKNHLEVKKFIKPGIFQKYKETGLEKGFLHVESGPLVRSSYHAEKHIL